MSVYLHDIPLSEAKAQFTNALQNLDLWKVLSSERILLDENAIGRILAEPVWALKSSPHYHASAMDGFAVRAHATTGALPASPVSLSIGEQAKYVDTGDPMPDWANAVIPIENIEATDRQGNRSDDIRKPELIRIRSSVAPWSHVRPMGEDIIATQLVLPAGHILCPYDLGAIAASGHAQVSVTKRPRVGILPTGTELVPIGTELNPGDILEYNSLVIAGQIKAMGAEPVRFPITIDDFEKIYQSVMLAAKSCDLVILNAGSSAGSEDYSSRIVEKSGKLLVHGVAVRPGHPVILGLITNFEDSNTRKVVPIIGVPGYPVSAALTVDIFVEPIIARWLGRKPLELPVAEALITRKTVSPPGDDDFLRVVVGKVGERVLAAPISRGAGVITSLVRADGFVVIPRGVQGLEAGDSVIVRMLRSQEEIEQTIFCIGSHDVILDIMSQFLSQKDRRLVSANVGSQGGLVALKRGEAHLAGSHLLDPDSGEYNVRYINEYLTGVSLKILGFVHREQGLIIRSGNPKKIKSLDDLNSGRVSFINRQRGAGTRVLLDYHLNLLGIDSSSINGYDDEEYTHLAVAAAVASGRADCGMGIPAAAQALDLGFVPLFNERYDLIIPKIYSDSELLTPLLSLLSSNEFKKAINKLPGYDTGIMGKLIMEV